jgi:hypothetical protein
VAASHSKDLGTPIVVRKARAAVLIAAQERTSENADNSRTLELEELSSHEMLKTGPKKHQRKL